MIFVLLVQLIVNIVAQCMIVKSVTRVGFPIQNHKLLVVTVLLIHVKNVKATVIVIPNVQAICCVQGLLVILMIS